ncbi:hypothetical protein D3C76_1224000 [compost metagenome]
MLAGTGATAAIAGAVGAGGVPGHTHKERAIVSEVRGPPILGVGHQRIQVVFDRRKIQALERFGIIEALVHGVGQGRVLVQDLQIQLVRPPVTVGCATASGLMERTFRFICHV